MSESPVTDLALINAGELVTCDGKGFGAEGLGVIEDGALVSKGGTVAWVGTTREYKRKSFGKPARMIDAGGQLVTPGFVDPHTHLLFAGSREDELERKAAGESYTQILKEGGGIARTIRETRRAKTSTIITESLGRLNELLSNGVTTVEVKTGYGQSVDGEIKMLLALAALRKVSRVEIVSTFLGLHATPPEFKSAKDYSAYATREILPRVAEMKDRPILSDCFCEEGVFSSAECERYLRASAELGFSCKVHADEFGDSGGASLAARTKCVSADHLGKSSADGIENMAKNGVAAVFLPGTSLFSGIPFADAALARKLGCTVALGTDLSPNSWIESPQLVMGLGCTGMKMTPAQAVLAFTINAAKAIKRTDIGRISEGCSADFAIHDVPGYKFLPYRLGGRYVRKVYKKGKEVYNLSDG